MDDYSELVTVGWREWLGLPLLGIPRIIAKFDTGARTSTLHACRVDIFQEAGRYRVSFDVHPFRGNTKKLVTCTADLLESRYIMDSGGHREERPVIVTTVAAGHRQWEIEISLTNRDDMRYRMLLGRTAMRDRFIINPTRAYLLGKPVYGVSN